MVFGLHGAGLDEYAYERLVLATGGRARVVPEWRGGVVYLRALDDYSRAREDAGARFA